MKVDLYQDINDFHKKFGIEHITNKKLLPVELMRYRMNFLQEELNEMALAYYDNDLHEVADAIVDLVYVALGTAYMMNLPFNELWTEVHKANMNKIRTPSKEYSKRGNAYDVIKPEGWQQPCFDEFLGEKL